MSAAPPEATSPSPASSVHVARVTQGRVLASEWIKMRSLRSTVLTLLAAVVAMVVLAWLIGWATNAHWNQMGPDERAQFNAIDRSLGGVNLAQLAIGVLGVLLVTGEYATGMIRATFAATPRRLPVIWAKAGLYAAVTCILMLVSAFFAFLIGQHFLATHGTTLGAPHAWRAIFGVAGYLTLIGILAVTFGFMIRSTAGGIASLFGLLLVLPGIGQLLPTSWQTHTLPYLPNNAGSAFYSANPDPSALSAGTGFVVLCLWVIAALVCAAIIVRRRDA